MTLEGETGVENQVGGHGGGEGSKIEGDFSIIVQRHATVTHHTIKSIALRTNKE